MGGTLLVSGSDKGREFLDVYKRQADVPLSQAAVDHHCVIRRIPYQIVQGFEMHITRCNMGHGLSRLSCLCACASYLPAENSRPVLSGKGHQLRLFLD